MIAQKTLGLVTEIGFREKSPRVEFLMGLACGYVLRANATNPDAQPTRELLELMAEDAKARTPVRAVEAKIEAWIGRDTVRRHSPTAHGNRGRERGRPREEDYA